MPLSPELEVTLSLWSMERTLPTQNGTTVISPLRACFNESVYFLQVREGSWFLRDSL